MYLDTANSSVDTELEAVNNFATVASFSIVAVLALLICVKLCIKIRKNWLWDSIGLIAFTAFFLPLMFIITSVITNSPRFWAIYLVIILYLVGFTTGIISAATPIHLGVRMDDKFDFRPPVFRTITSIIEIFIIGLIFEKYPEALSGLDFAVEFSKGVPLAYWVEYYSSIALAFAMLLSLGAFCLFLIVLAIWVVWYLALGLGTVATIPFDR
ncbi:hypothetical protein [Haloarcula argentinensis]|uniref:Uncharacterized protein n=1 Tax=Haloarcula argentinensis TaxID=43776 RepID=A0A847URS0_HALAR|nr:hypothetical protein [Haloarcula argentinensis]NLV15201.1 hypothetical protein [Haloarcula argentinensis]